MRNPLKVHDLGGDRISVERVISALTAVTGALIAVLIASGTLGAEEGETLGNRLSDAIVQAGPLVSLGILWWRARGRAEPAP